jgi:prepilin-type N-terminal cleavage/methylation domain-containing protein
MLILNRQNRAHLAGRPSNAFTLVEVLVALSIFGFVSTGIIWGYVQANRLAEWSSMSLGAQSYALQGIEQARSAKWDTAAYNEVTADFLPVATSGPSVGTTNYTQIDTNDVPHSGAPLLLTNIITITDRLTGGPDLREIRSDVIWRFPLTGKLYTNTVITFRAPDQ